MAKPCSGFPNCVKAGAYCYAVNFNVMILKGAGHLSWQTFHQRSFYFIVFSDISLATGISAEDVITTLHLLEFIDKDAELDVRYTRTMLILIPAPMIGSKLSHIFPHDKPKPDCQTVLR